MLGPDREREEQETRNANALMQFVGEYVRNNPNALLTEPLLLKFHEVLTAGIDYRYNEPGRYRSHAVNVGRVPASIDSGGGARPDGRVLHLV